MSSNRTQYTMVIRELEDFAWFPPLLRQYQVEIIGEIAKKMRVYRAVATPLHHLLSVAGKKKFTDLCSGSGLPASGLLCEMKDESITGICTDLYPQRFSPSKKLTMQQQPVNVLTFIPEKEEVYTMLNAFHHFDDAQKKTITGQMIRSDAKFLFVEILEPGLFSFLQILLGAVVGTLIFTPLIRPFSWKRIVLTYAFPVNLMTVVTDGLLSVLRATSEAKLNNLFKEEIERGEVEVFRTFSFPVFVTYIKSTK